MRLIAVMFPLVVVVAMLAMPGAPVRAQPQGRPVACIAPAVVESSLPAVPVARDVGRIRSVALASQEEDTSDSGNGSFRLCLEGELPVKGPAWCDWSEDRSAILSAHTRTYVRAAGRRLHLYLGTAISLGDDAPADRHLEIGTRAGALYDTRFGSLDMQQTEDGGFVLTFEAPRTERVDLPAMTGSLGIRCGAPPPMEQDQTVGRLTFRVSDLPGRVFETSAVCSRAMRGHRRTVWRVSGLTTRAKVADDRFVSLELDMTAGHDRSVRAHLTWTTAFDFSGDDLVDLLWTFPLWTPANRRSGTVHAARLLTEEERETEEVPTGTPSRSMLGTWTCDGPPERVRARIDDHSRVGRPGLVTVHVPGMPATGVVAGASCRAREDHGRTFVDSVAASFRLDGRDALLIGNASGFVGLYLRDPDGTFEGALFSGPVYQWRNVWSGDDHGHVDIPTLVLVRDLVSPDPTVPRFLPIRVEWDCQPGRDART